MISLNNGKHNQHVIILIVGILFIAMNLRAPFTALPPLLEMISHNYGLTSVTAGILTTLPLLAFAIVSPFSAALARKFGLERTLFAALMIIALGILLRSLENIWCLYLGSWTIGTGIAIGNVLLPSLIKRDFPNKIASITGAYILTMGIAAAICSAIAIPLAQSLGWRIALGTFLILPIITSLLWLKQLKLQTQSTSNTAPSDYNSRALWRSALAWQITLFLGLNSAIYYIVVGWLPIILIESGMTPAAAGSQHGIMQLATAIPGLILAPILSKLKDQRIAAAVSCMLSAIALLGILTLPQWAFLWAIVFGIGTGSGIILGLTFIGLRTQNAHQAAALSGMSQCIGYLLAAMGPIVIGALHDHFNGWSVPLILSIMLAVSAAIIGTFAGRNLQIKS